MSNEYGYDDDARWLQSDGNIVGKVHRKPDPQGIRLTLDMPDGEPVVAVVEKLNAASMSQFCEIARGEYHERKAEQASKEERASRSNEERKGRTSAGLQKVVQGAQTSVVISPLDPSSIRSRLSEISSRVIRLDKETKALNIEGTMLVKILEVLDDAQVDDEETAGRLQTAEVTPQEREDEGGDVDIPSCEAQLLETGEAGTVESDPGLGSLPDAEA